jgi:hypothetical protein
MSKFLYQFSVIRNDNGLNKVVLDRHHDKAAAERLAVAAINNVPGRSFKVRTHRVPNPAYAGE